MSTAVTDLNQRIGVVNGRIAKLMDDRNVGIGRRDALTQQLAQAVAGYKQKFGVDLDVVGIDTELQRVSAEKEAEVSKVESVLQLITEGRFAEAEQIIGGGAVPEVQTEVDSKLTGVAPDLNLSDVTTVPETVETVSKEEHSAALNLDTVPKMPETIGVAPKISNPVATGAPAAPKMPNPIASEPREVGMPPIFEQLSGGTPTQNDGFMPTVMNSPVQSEDTPPAPPAPPTGVRKSFSSLAGGKAFQP